MYFSCYTHYLYNYVLEIALEIIDMRIRLSDLREPAFVKNLHIPYYRFWQTKRS